VSHIAPCISWIFRLRELGYAAWRDDAMRLIARSERVIAINTASYWEKTVAVEAFRGYEGKIADLVEYACRVCSRFMRECIEDESRMTFAHLRQDLLDPIGSATVPIPLNDVMVATFTLSFLDIAHRMIGWLRSHDLHWPTLKVLLSGKSGRPSAGLTWQTNNNCHLLWQASERRLSPENVQITPHGPSLARSELADTGRVARIEQEVRAVFLHLRANIDLSRLMFAGYPAFEKSVEEPPVIDAVTRSLHAMPQLRSPDDRQTAITRLRFVMEDPAQLLSNSVAHFVIEQLCQHDNEPLRVVIPGFSAVTYPKCGVH
jgi:hypothetical protein